MGYHDAMLITSVHVSGFRDLPNFNAKKLGRVVCLKGPGPSTTALGDAIQLCFAALNPVQVAPLLRRWGVLAPDEVPEIIGAPFPDQAIWTDQTAAKALVADPIARTLKVTLELRLDPILFGQLRALATRDPRLVSALAKGSTAKIEVGALFTQTFDAVAFNVHKLVIGNEAFSTKSTDQPKWVGTFLNQLSNRAMRHNPVQAVQDVAQAAMDAATSQTHFQNYCAWQSALTDPYGSVRAARGPEGTAVLLANELPIRRWGASAIRRAAAASSAFLSNADVLWIQTEDPWIEQFVESDDAPLEQIWRVCEDGEMEVSEQPEKHPKRTTLPMKRQEK